MIKKILDPDEWKVVKNMHEPLVSQKDFDKAQKRLQSNKKVKRGISEALPVRNGGMRNLRP